MSVEQIRIGVARLFFVSEQAAGKGWGVEGYAFGGNMF